MLATCGLGERGASALSGGTGGWREDGVGRRGLEGMGTVTVVGVGEMRAGDGRRAVTEPVPDRGAGSLSAGVE